MVRKRIPNQAIEDALRAKVAERLKKRLKDSTGMRTCGGVLVFKERIPKWGWTPNPRRWALSTVDKAAIGISLLISGCLIFFAAAKYTKWIEYEHRIKEFVKKEHNEECYSFLDEGWSNCSRACGGGNRSAWAPPPSDQDAEDCKIRISTPCNTSPCPAKTKPGKKRRCYQSLKTADAINQRFVGQVRPVEHYRHLIKCLLCEWASWSCLGGACVRAQKVLRSSADFDCNRQQTGRASWSLWSNECKLDEPGGKDKRSRYRILAVDTDSSIVWL